MKWKLDVKWLLNRGLSGISGIIGIIGVVAGIKFIKPAIFYYVYSRLIPMKLSIKKLCGAHLLLRRTFPRFPKRIPILPTQKFYF